LRRRIRRGEILVRLDAAGHIEIDHAGFDDYARVRQVHFQNAIHAREADDHTVFNRQRTAAQAGAFVSSLVFGYLVKLTGSYNAPLIPMVFMLVLSALMWLKIDPTEQLVPES